jgi:hypothetical protein
MSESAPSAERKVEELEIGRGSFRQATIREITIPSWVEVLPSEFFKEYARLVNVTVCREAHLKIIEMEAFAGTPLTGFAVPASVSTIDGSAFAVNICENRRFRLTVDQGNNLFKVEVHWLVESGVRMVWYFGWSAPDSVLKIPLKYSVIGARSFTGIKTLRRIEFGKRETPLVIEDFAFWKANLPEIVLTPRIQVIGIRAFDYITMVRLEKGCEEPLVFSQWKIDRWSEQVDSDG